MTYLNPTPPAAMVDSLGRPYFPWDQELTLTEFRSRLAATDPVVRGYSMAKLMRQAKPDDIFEFVSLSEIRNFWDRITPNLGDRREFWVWLLDSWSRKAHEA